MGKFHKKARLYELTKTGERTIQKENEQGRLINFQAQKRDGSMELDNDIKTFKSESSKFILQQIILTIMGEAFTSKYYKNKEVNINRRNCENLCR